MAQHILWSCGCTWRTVKDLKNSLLATCFRGDASNSVSPYLGKIISVLLIGQLKNSSMVSNKLINKENLDASGLYASGETNRLLVAANIMVAKRRGVRKATAKRSDEPCWKRRIKQKIMQLRKDDISRLAKVSN